MMCYNSEFKVITVKDVITFTTSPACFICDCRGGQKYVRLAGRLICIKCYSVYTPENILKL